MEGFGFQNFDDSFESSSPPTYTSEPYGFDNSTNRINKTGNKDMYDFDVRHEEDTPQKPARTRNIRRMSTDDRINEILEKSKLSKPQPKKKEESEEEDTFNSWKNSWNQLMEGVGADSSPKPTALEDSVDSPDVDQVRPAKVRRSLNASDSLDISDADFEVYHVVLY